MNQNGAGQLLPNPEAALYIGSRPDKEETEVGWGFQNCKPKSSAHNQVNDGGELITECKAAVQQEIIE